MSFEKDLSIKDELDSDVNQVTRAVALGMLRDLVLLTPVDTGRARGNWQVSEGSFKSGEVDRLDKSGGSTISEGSAEIAATTNIDYPTIWLVNNLPYIQRLDEGSSDQAPTGMTSTALKRAKTLQVKLK